MNRLDHGAIAACTHVNTYSNHIVHAFQQLGMTIQLVVDFLIFCSHTMVMVLNYVRAENACGSR